MLIDAHSHAFQPEEVEVIAQRMELLDASLPPEDPNKWYLRTGADLAGLVAAMAEAGVDRMVLLPVTGKAERTADLIRWSAEAARRHPQIIPFGTLHPGGRVAEDLALMTGLGLKGVKLHPFIQRFALDAPQTLKMLRLIAEAGLPVTMDTLFNQGLVAAKPHLAWLRQVFGFAGAAPEQVAAAARAVPGLRLIAAHGGCLYGWDRLEPLMGLDNVYFDLSYLKGLLPPERVVELVRAKGPERVLYGSDAPYRHPARHRQWFEELPLTPAEREMVAAGTARRLLDL
jgi:hypothetical protein